IGGGRIPQATSAALAAQLLGHDTRASEAAIRAERKLRLEAALNSMDPLDREVLALRHFEQLSNAECARVLALSESAATKRYIRAEAPQGDPDRPARRRQGVLDMSGSLANPQSSDRGSRGSGGTAVTTPAILILGRTKPSPADPCHPGSHRTGASRPRRRCGAKCPWRSARSRAGRGS